MRRLLPFPLLTLALMAMWLLLAREISPADLIGAVLMGVGGPLAIASLELPRRHIRRPWAVMRLLGLAFADVVRSNNAVAMIVWHPRLRGQSSGFVDIPLDLRSPYGLAVLAIIITATPGTLWSKYDPANGVMRLHVLDLIDESDWVSRIKNRYERLLLEIFE
ncbi:MAG TPA: Na+/H+ antiporter subunit E [Burkholderiales bacterium]|nr:Na+/H+ antiporter subunit E [Burkholderiales bacterium]